MVSKAPGPTPQQRRGDGGRTAQVDEGAQEDDAVQSWQRARLPRRPSVFAKPLPSLLGEASARPTPALNILLRTHPYLVVLCASRGPAERESSVLLCTACAQSPPQHGKRRKTQEILEEMARLEIEIEDATIDVACTMCLLDMMKALDYTKNGTVECIQCEYMNVREADELLLWEQENSGMIDRWLRFRHYAVTKAVSVGGCGHASMRWQVEERMKNAE